ncbi:MAG: hypothetical protein ACRD4R_17400 [Candidatus Acidiferrales bacterium]
MSTSPERIARIECQVGDDPRLIAGASVIVAHVARRAGLSGGAATEIALAASDSCSAAFHALREPEWSWTAIKLGAAEFPDHIEVTIEPLLEKSKAAGGRFSSMLPADFTDKIRAKLKNAALDGFDVGLRDGIPRITLVKCTGAAKRRFVV